MQTRFLPLTFLILLFVFLGFQSFATVTIDSIRTTTSNCGNNGTITVFARGTHPPLNYAIIAGPTTRPLQGSNTFSALDSGVYTIMVVGLANDTARQTVMVRGTYRDLNFTPTSINPICSNSPTGTIIGNPQTNTGVRPYTWTLTNTGTGAVITQPRDTFRNLPPGNYTLRLTDSCNNFTTRNITLNNPNTAMSLYQIQNKVVGCDSTLILIRINKNTPGFNQGTYSVRVNRPGGSFTVGATPDFSPTLYYELQVLVPGFSYGTSLNLVVYNNCGDSLVILNTVSPFLFPTYSIATTGSQCSVKKTITLFLGGNLPNQRFTFMKSPLIATIRDSATNAFVDTVAFRDQDYYFLVLKPLNTGKTYRITVVDGCGRTVTQNIYLAPPNPPSSTKVITGLHCLDSTNSVQITALDFLSGVNLQFLSGPNFIQSTKNKYNYRDTIVYPGVIRSPNNGPGKFFVTNLVAGTYRYRIFDSCGNSIIDSFVLTRSSVANSFSLLTYKLGCVQQNKLFIRIFSTNVAGTTVIGGGRYTVQNLTNGVTYANSVSFGYNSSGGYNFIDSLSGLPSGQYVLTLDYSTNIIAGSQINPTLTCKVITDTIFIPANSPPRIRTVNFVACSGNKYAALVVDSSVGVPPYSFEIVSGPQTRPLQPSNIFVLNQPGVYSARISDACGSATTYSFAMDTVAFSSIIKNGSSCVGGSVKLYNVSSSYVTYTWRRPNGTVYVGDTLSISPVLNTDTGIYNITKRVSISGCVDSFKTAYRLVTNIQNTISASICQGRTYRVGNNFYSVAGTYRDTIPTATCDSIVILTLTVNPYKRDTINRTICFGSTFTVGTRTYSTSGTYRDTFSTAGCDSIVLLNLTVLPQKITNLNTSICANRSITIGTRTYTQAGLYQDTLQSGGCDSIVVLNLSVTPLKGGNISRSICAGDSFRVGNKYYKTAGNYRDTLAAAPGCDSIVALTLTVLPFSRDTQRVTICEGTGYTVGTRTYTTTGIYRDTFGTTGCDSIVTLFLTVTPLARKNIFDTICPGGSSYMGGIPYTSTGVYRDTFSTSTCDSIVTLHLFVRPLKRTTLNTSICEGRSITVGTNTYNSSGTTIDTIPTATCDSIVTLNLTVLPLKRSNIVTSICANKSFRVGNKTYNQAGNYTDTLTTPTCDSIVNLTLSITPLKTFTQNVTICEGRNLRVGNSIYTTAGTYVDTIATSGCDSVVTTTLSINPYKRDSATATICEGTRYSVGTNHYTTTGIYFDTIATAGCDSIFKLNLTVTPLKRDTLRTTICENDSAAFGGNFYKLAGTYRDTFATSGCDSIATLILSVSPFKRTTTNQTICEGDSFWVGNKFYHVAGTYRDTLATPTCDSIHTLHLTIAPLKRVTLNTSICANRSIRIGNNTYNQAGTYIDTIATASCDSIVTLNLSITPLPITQLDTSICPGQSVVVGNNTYTSTGNFVDTIPTLGCDSIVRLRLQLYSNPLLNVTASSYDVVRGDTVMLNANGNMPLNYQWTGNAAFQNAQLESTSAMLTNSTWLTVRASSGDSCIVVDSLFITVRECGNVAFYMPNAFTPNGDGKNDKFQPVGRFVTLNKMQIFNRWGELVFETYDMENGWDGNYRNAAQPVGVYVYWVNYSACGSLETKEMTGSLTLLR